MYLLKGINLHFFYNLQLPELVFLNNSDKILERQDIHLSNYAIYKIAVYTFACLSTYFYLQINITLTPPSMFYSK